MKFVLISAAAAALLAPGEASAKKADDTAIGAAFIDVCIRTAPDRAAVRAAIAAGQAWTPTPVSAELSFTRTAKAAGAVTNPTRADTWTQVIDGREVPLVLIGRDLSPGPKTACAFVIRDPRQAMWYFRSVSDKKAFGVKLKDQDIPHYRLHSGKLANGQRAQVTLRSKSDALPEKDFLHLVMAY